MMSEQAAKIFNEAYATLARTAHLVEQREPDPVDADSYVTWVGSVPLRRYRNPADAERRQRRMAARSTTPASGTAQPAGVFGPLQDEVLGRMFGADRRRMRELEERLAEERRKRENVERRLAVSEFRLDEQQSALWKREAETSEREAEMMPECADHDADRRGRLNA